MGHRKKCRIIGKNRVNDRNGVNVQSGAIAVSEGGAGAIASQWSRRNLSMTQDEQDVYSWMGISPLVLTAQEIKNPRNTYIAVTLPGEAPPEPPTSAAEGRREVVSAPVAEYDRYDEPEAPAAAPPAREERLVIESRKPIIREPIVLDAAPSEDGVSPKRLIRRRSREEVAETPVVESKTPILRNQMSLDLSPDKPEEPQVEAPEPDDDDDNTGPIVRRRRRRSSAT
jgi:ribonuclease E